MARIIPQWLKDIGFDNENYLSYGELALFDKAQAEIEKRDALLKRARVGLAVEGSFPELRKEIHLCISGEKPPLGPVVKCIHCDGTTPASEDLHVKYDKEETCQKNQRTYMSTAEVAKELRRLADLI